MPIVAHNSLIDAAGKKIKKSTNGEQLITGVVNGGARVVSGMSGAVERATSYSQRTARKDDEPAPKKQATGWRSAFSHAYKVMTDPQYAKKKALENTKEHHRQMSPFVNRVHAAAKKQKSSADDTSSKLDASHGTVGNVTSKAAELIPEVLTAGSSTRAKVANALFGAAKDFGEGKSVAGAAMRRLIPGNTKTANVLSNLATDEAAK